MGLSKKQKDALESLATIFSIAASILPATIQAPELFLNDSIDFLRGTSGYVVTGVGMLSAATLLIRRDIIGARAEKKYLENFKEVIRDFSDHSDNFKNQEFIKQCIAKLTYFDDLTISHQEMDRIKLTCKILEQEFDDYEEISDSARVMALLTLKNCYWRITGALRRYEYEGEKALEI